jgi:hypothetical protein
MKRDVGAWIRDIGSSSKNGHSAAAGVERGFVRDGVDP